MMRILMATIVLVLASIAARKAIAAVPPGGIAACPTESDARDVTAVVRRMEQTLQGSSSVGTMTMTIKTPGGRARSR